MPMTSLTDSLHHIPKAASPRAEDQFEAARLLTLMRIEHKPLRMVDSTGEAANIEGNVATKLYELLALMAEGHQVTILPTETRLTTQAAADILNISRQYLVRLLDNGILPVSKVGTHRRVLLADVIAYKQRRDAGRHEALDRLTDLSLAFDGYEDSEP